MVAGEPESIITEDSRFAELIVRCLHSLLRHSALSPKTPRYCSAYAPRHFRGYDPVHRHPNRAPGLDRTGCLGIVHCKYLFCQSHWPPSGRPNLRWQTRLLEPVCRVKSLQPFEKSASRVLTTLPKTRNSQANTKNSISEISDSVSSALSPSPSPP